LLFLLHLSMSCWLLLVSVSVLLLTIQVFSNPTRIIPSISEKFDAITKILLVIPGLGRSDRLRTVVHNVKLLFQQQSSGSTVFDLSCVIYIYAPKSDTSFWSSANEEQISFLSSKCQLLENPGKKVTENLFMVQPFYLYNQYHYIFLLLDDVKVKDSETFSLSSMISVMRCNGLSVLSPLVRFIIYFFY
jgi:hypothetical protein